MLNKYIKFLKPDIEYVVFSDIYNSKDKDAICKAGKLLKFIHDGIYVAHFPLADEQESFETWENLLNGKKHIYIALGQNLNSNNPNIAGFIVVGLYNKSGLVEYIIRTKEYKNRLRGIEMLHLAIEHLNKLSHNINNESINCMYWELNDPDKIEFNTNTDCMSPLKRMNLVKQTYNGKLLGFDYIQPPLTEGQDICDNLRLARIDVEYSDLNKDKIAQQLKDYLSDFVQRLTQKNPYEVMATEPKINRMFKQVDFMIQQHISPFEDEQTQKEKLLISEIV